MKVRNFFLSMTVMVHFVFSACTAAGVLNRVDENRITLMSYNAQAFFDAIEDGSEFSEFIGPRTKWTEAMYIDRLDRLREVLLLCGREAGMGPDKGPDIVVLQEIENERVLRDLCNRLPQRCAYISAAFIPPGPGSSFGSALLSRYPLESLSAHSIDGSNEILRPLLQIQLKTGNSSLVIFAAHWKSKSGTADTSSIRQLQEVQLLERIGKLEKSNPEIPFVVCGDFNQNRDEFTVMNSYRNCWDWWLMRCASSQEPGPEGSYFFQDSWETIDNIFYSASLGDGSGLDFASFRVVASSPLVSDSKIPARYDLYSGKGYSDHLPLLLELRRIN